MIIIANLTFVSPELLCAYIERAQQWLALIESLLRAIVWVLRVCKLVRERARLIQTRRFSWNMDDDRRNGVLRARTRIIRGQINHFHWRHCVFE